MLPQCLGSLLLSVLCRTQGACLLEGAWRIIPSAPRMAPLELPLTFNGPHLQTITTGTSFGVAGQPANP